MCNNISEINSLLEFLNFFYKNFAFQLCRSRCYSVKVLTKILVEHENFLHLLRVCLTKKKKKISIYFVIALNRGEKFFP